MTVLINKGGKAPHFDHKRGSVKLSGILHAAKTGEQHAKPISSKSVALENWPAGQIKMVKKFAKKYLCFLAGAGDLCVRPFAPVFPSSRPPRKGGRKGQASTVGFQSMSLRAHLPPRQLPSEHPV